PSNSTPPDQPPNLLPCSNAMWPVSSSSPPVPAAPFIATKARNHETSFWGTHFRLFVFSWRCLRDQRARQPPGAVAQSVCMHADVVENGEQQIRHRRPPRIDQMAPPLKRP